MSYHHLGQEAESSPSDAELALESLKGRARRLGFNSVTEALDQLDIEDDGLITKHPKL